MRCFELRAELDTSLEDIPSTGLNERGASYLLGYTSEPLLISSTLAAGPSKALVEGIGMNCVEGPGTETRGSKCDVVATGRAIFGCFCCFLCL